MEVLPKIKVRFFIKGDVSDVYDIYDRMEIDSAKIREKKDFPIEEYATNSWGFQTEKEHCKAVSYQVGKVIGILKGKVETINTICEEYDATTGFIVYIHTESRDGPDMVLTKEILSFMASINAEIGFDLYIY